MEVGGRRTPQNRLDEERDSPPPAAEVDATISDVEGEAARTKADPRTRSPSPDPARANRPARAVAPHGQLGRYVLGKKLGAGGMALVYRAHDPALDRELAIKVLRPRMRGEAARDRLRREAQAMARLEHANVVPVFDVGTTGDNVYLVMPYMAGGTLGRWLGAEQRPWRAVLARFVAAGRGLAAAHRQGIIHRDFKPDNVLLGADDEVRVADFGLAAFAAHPTPMPDGTPSPAMASHLTRTGTVLGTPIYMAPEQLCGKPIDARSDQFSFCVALWEGLYGERPFRPDTSDTESELEGLLGAIRRGPPAPSHDRGVPRWLRALVARGLRPDPAERWPSLDDLLAHAVARQRRPLKIAAALGVGLAAAAIIAGAAAISGAGESAGVGPDAASPAQDVGAGARAFRVSRVTARGRIYDAAVSDDGQHVAWAVEGEIVIQSARDGSMQRVVLRDAPDATLAFAPDGERLAVTNPPGRTRIVHVRSGAVVLDAAVGSPHLSFAGPDTLVYAGRGTTLEQRPLASLLESRSCALPGYVSSVVDLTTDARGEVLLVADLTGGRRGLIRVGADCKKPVLLRTDDWLDAVAASGDRSYGLLRTDGDVSLVGLARDGRVVEVRSVDGDTTDLDGVTSDGRAYFTRMAYEWRLVEIDSAGNSLERGAGSQRTELNGSADGEWVAWIEDADGHRLRVAPTDRMADRPAPIATGVMTVAWAPDGRRLAAIIETGDDHELVVMDLSGAALRRLPVADLDVDDWLAWMGDDAVVASSADNKKLVRIDLDDGSVQSLLEEPGEVFDPQTTPDGTILFPWERDERGKSGVWLRAPDGRLTMLREDSDGSMHGAWVPGGDSMLLYDRKSGQVWRMARSGSDPVRAVPVPLAGNEWMPALWSRGPDRVLAHVVRRTTDLHVSRPQ
jgi:hypothetical protein